MRGRLHLAGPGLIEFVDQIVDRLDQRIERILVAVEQHPGRQRRAAALIEGIEGKIDHLPRGAFTRAGRLHRIGDHIADLLGVIDRQFLLQPRSRAEMVQQVGMGAPDSRGNGLECHRLWPQLDQQRARRLERGKAAFFLGQALSY